MASAAIAAPFVLSGGHVAQSVETGVDDGGSMVLSFNIPTTGNYVVVLSVDAPNASADSVFVDFDQTPGDPTAIADIPITAGMENRTLNWRGNGTPAASQFVPKIWALAADTHTLVIKGREANCRIFAAKVGLADGHTVVAAPGGLRIVD